MSALQFRVQQLREEVESKERELAEIVDTVEATRSNLDKAYETARRQLIVSSGSGGGSGLSSGAGGIAMMKTASTGGEGFAKVLGTVSGGANPGILSNRRPSGGMFSGGRSLNLGLIAEGDEEEEDDPSDEAAVDACEAGELEKENKALLAENLQLLKTIHHKLIVLTKSEPE